MTFEKFNQTAFDDALIKESHGLTLLEETLQQNKINIKVPKILNVNSQSLSLQRIHQAQASKEQWQQLGHALAQLHLIKQTHYGHHENNYIGMNPQKNTITDDWGCFFLHQRLLTQVNLIKSEPLRNLFSNDLLKVADGLIQFLNNSCDFPSLLHGDLWSGNVLFDKQDIWLIDPAVYYGDADADLAMTELFGGFPKAFYQVYEAAKPLSDVYSTKSIIYNLYHYLNHYNLFGSCYLDSCYQSFKLIDQFFA